MTDKVQKIREEVERRIIFQKECIKNSYRLTGKPEEEIILEYKQLLSFINSLQEEPVRKTSADIESAMQEVEEKSKAFTKAHKKESSDEILAQMRGEESIRYDPMKFEPFQKVLIRMEDGDSWEADLFGTYKPLCDNHYHCVGGWWPQCIPYEGNENLLGTHDNCDKYYVT